MRILVTDKKPVFINYNIKPYASLSALQRVVENYLIKKQAGLKGVRSVAQVPPFFEAVVQVHPFLPAQS